MTKTSDWSPEGSPFCDPLTVFGVFRLSRVISYVCWGRVKPLNPRWHIHHCQSGRFRTPGPDGNRLLCASQLLLKLIRFHYRLQRCIGRPTTGARVAVIDPHSGRNLCLTTSQQTHTVAVCVNILRHRLNSAGLTWTMDVHYTRRPFLRTRRRGRRREASANLHIQIQIY